MDEFQKDVLQRLARIEEFQKHPSPECSVHTEQIGVISKRLESLEAQAGRQNLIAMTIGAIGASIVLALKVAVGKL